MSPFQGEDIAPRTGGGQGDIRRAPICRSVITVKAKHKPGLSEDASLREGQLCAQEGITINIFLLNSWNQTQEDVRFAYRLAESTRGRVFFTAGSLRLPPAGARRPMAETVS